jgi:ethanolamine utilization protein EutN
VRLARVVGTTVATVKEPNLTGMKLLLCAPCTIEGAEEEVSERFVAVDTIGAGVGEVVLVAVGSSARATDRTKSAPTDATVIGIVDSVQLGGQATYVKGESR